MSWVQGHVSSNSVLFTTEALIQAVFTQTFTSTTEFLWNSWLLLEEILYSLTFKMFALRSNIRLWTARCFHIVIKCNSSPEPSHRLDIIIRVCRMALTLFLISYWPLIGLLHKPVFFCNWSKYSPTYFSLKEIGNFHLAPTRLMYSILSGFLMILKYFFIFKTHFCTHYITVF